MSVSKELKFLVKREDTGKMVRLEMTENMQVYDLLESSKSPLNFPEDSILSVRRKGDDEDICETTFLYEMADPKIVLIISDERAAKEEKMKFKEKKEAKDRKNLAKAKKTKEEVEEKLKKPNASHDHGAFRENFTNVSQSFSSPQHELLNDLKTQTNSRERAEKTLREITEDEEITILNRKINNGCLDGFVYDIIPDSYADHNESTYNERSFSSEDERRATQSKVRSTSDWSSWQAEAGFSGWGVSVSASAGQDKSASQHEGTKTEKMEKANIAIVTKTSFHQMKRFGVKVKLSEKGIKDAKQILKASMHEKQQSINDFNSKYCSLIYSGQFTAGGWLRIVATAKSTVAMDFAALENEANDKLETHWSAGVSGYGINVGGGQNKGQSSQTSNHQSQQNTKSTVQITIRKESAPGNTSNENDLETKIKDAKNWTVFPIVEAKKSHFTEVYEIMKTQAKETRDKELENVSEILRMYMKGVSRMGSILTPPYIVLVGDVGTGKSTIVEKLTGEKGRSSDANESCTRTSEPFWVPDGSLIISDTPGSNSRKEQLQHNVWIAGALNFRPVSKIFIVVKADPRMDAVIDAARKYADRFLDLPMDAVGVIVTHMDLVGWTKEDFNPAIDEDLGIDTVVYSWITTKGETLLGDIRETCKKRYNLTVNDEDFFRLFKIHNHNRKILKCTSDEVKSFTEKKKAFDEARKAFSVKDQVDLAFEFQAYMTDEIVEAQKRLSEENNFTFSGDGAANEAGHVANMVNQLRMVLYDIRTECLAFQNEHGVSELRKCPYCGLIWTKVEGCDGDTTCGKRPDSAYDIRDTSFSVLGTFAFTWIGNKLGISKTGEKNVQVSEKSSNSRTSGCGATINWKQMATVDLPAEFSKTVKVCTTDINMLLPKASGFKEELGMKINDATKRMKLSDRPSSSKET